MMLSDRLTFLGESLGSVPWTFGIVVGCADGRD